MPTLIDDGMGQGGIQYVGMIRPVSTDYDYILTDVNGNIDCFSSGVGALFNLSPNIFKEDNMINI